MAGNCTNCEKMRNWFIRGLSGNRVRITMKSGPPTITKMIGRTGPKTLSTDAGDIDMTDIDDVNRLNGANPTHPPRP